MPHIGRGVMPAAATPVEESTEAQRAAALSPLPPSVSAALDPVLDDSPGDDEPGSWSQPNSRPSTIEPQARSVSRHPSPTGGGGACRECQLEEGLRSPLAQPPPLTEEAFNLSQRSSASRSRWVTPDEMARQASAEGGAATMEGVAKSLRRLGRQLETLQRGQQRIEDAMEGVQQKLHKAAGPANLMSPGGMGSTSIPIRKQTRVGNDSFTEVQTARSSSREGRSRGARGVSGEANSPRITSQSERPSESSLRSSERGDEAQEGPDPRREEPLRRRTMMMEATRYHVSMTSVLSEGSAIDEREHCGVAIHPGSVLHVAIDLLSLLVLNLDAVLLPYLIAWQLFSETWVAVYLWITTAFWTVDFLAGFAIGFYKENRAHRNFCAVWRHYGKTTFAPNFLVCATDWASMRFGLTSFGTPHQDLGRLLLLTMLVARIGKLKRALRVFALLRVGTLAPSLECMQNGMRRWGLGDEIAVAAKILKAIALIAYISHVGSCVWRTVGEAAIQDWYRSNGVDKDSISEYWLNFYWSISAVLAGESVMVPQTTGEIVVTALFILFGIIFCSMLISVLATTLMNYHEANREQTTKLNLVRQYLYQRKVEPAIAMGVERQVKLRMGSAPRLTLEDVPALMLLSNRMRGELWYNVYGAELGCHQFLRACLAVDHTFVKVLCFNAIGVNTRSAGHVEFEPDEHASKAFYVSCGGLEYLVAGAPFLAEVKPGSWVAELALWTHWRHVGVLEVCTATELIEVLADGFVRILRNHSELRRLARDYAGALLRAATRESSGRVNDVNFPVSHESIVSAMPAGSRAQMSQPAMDALEAKGGWTFFRKNLEGLAEEVRTGQSDLVFDGKDRILRVVHVAALRLVREDGRLLACVAEWDRGSTVPGCKLPFTKVQRGETPRDALQRLLQQHLRVLVGGVTVPPGEEEETEAEEVSQTTGVNTRYLRTVFNATLRREFEETLSLDIIKLKEGDSNCAPSREASLLSIPNLSTGRGQISRGFWPSERIPSGGGASGGRRDFDPAQRDVFHVRSQEARRHALYSWLPLTDFKYLTSQAGLDATTSWLSRLDLAELFPGAVDVDSGGSATSPFGRVGRSSASKVT